MTDIHRLFVSRYPKITRIIPNMRTRRTYTIHLRRRSTQVKAFNNAMISVGKKRNLFLSFGSFTPRPSVPLRGNIASPSSATETKSVCSTALSQGI